MITILLEQIIQLITGWINAFNDHADIVENKLDSIDSTASDIKDNTDSLPDIEDNTAAVITPINNIKSNTDSIASSNTAISNNTTAIMNQVSAMSTNVGRTAAYAEDCANNSLDILDKVTTIASDTTQIRTDSDSMVLEQSKIYDAVKWLLADKTTTETETAEDSITFNTDIADDLVSLQVGLTATQSGSGDPSPVDNVRTIIGYSSVNLTVNGSSVVISLGDTYYGGVLDVTSGNLTIDKAIIVIDGTQTITVSSQSYIKSDACDCFTYVNNIYPQRPPQSQADGFAISDKLKPAKRSIWSDTGYANCFTFNNDQLHINISNDLLGITDYTQETIITARSKMYSFFTNNNITFMYGIQPVVISLTPEQISTITGDNVISTDTNGNVTVTYTESIKHYLDKQDNA